MKFIRSAAILLIFSLTSVALVAQTYPPSESNLKARQWFQDAKFGMFIHWGANSVPADGEGVMEITPRRWGVTTQKAGKTYVHVRDLADEYLALPPLPGVKQAHLFGTNAKLEEGFGRWPAPPHTKRRSRSGRHDRGAGVGTRVSRFSSCARFE